MELEHRSPLGNVFAPASFAQKPVMLPSDQWNSIVLIAHPTQE